MENMPLVPHKGPASLLWTCVKWISDGLCKFSVRIQDIIRFNSFSKAVLP